MSLPEKEFTNFEMGPSEFEPTSHLLGRLRRVNKIELILLASIVIGPTIVLLSSLFAASVCYHSGQQLATVAPEASQLLHRSDNQGCKFSNSTFKQPNERISTQNSDDLKALVEFSGYLQLERAYPGYKASNYLPLKLKSVLWNQNHNYQSLKSNYGARLLSDQTPYQLLVDHFKRSVGGGVNYGDIHIGTSRQMKLLTDCATINFAFANKVPSITYKLEGASIIFDASNSLDGFSGLIYCEFGQRGSKDFEFNRGYKCDKSIKYACKIPDYMGQSSTAVYLWVDRFKFELDGHQDRIVAELFSDSIREPFNECSD